MTGTRENRRTFVQRALGGHAAIGLLAGALIYIICLSGALVVIHDRWQRWEQPDIAEMASLSPEAAQAAMAAVVASEVDKPRTTHLYIRMPTGDLPRASVTTDNGAWYVDGAGRVVGREANAWIEFVIGLHEYLHLPTLWGLILVGALGVALACVVVTGVLAHPRILRDAFRLRIRQDPQIARTDLHNRLGVWTLPFTLAVALTGAFIGLGSVGVTVLADVYASGQVEEIYEPIFGSEPPPDAAAASLPDIAAALRQVAARAPEASPTYVVVHEPGTAGQHVQVIAEHPRRLIYGETYSFSARGQWLGPVGLSDGSLGQQFAASNYNLHFGNFGGLAVELGYMLLGLALCVVTATGTSLWLQKRRRAGFGGHRLQACWDVVIWGTPLAFVGLIWLRAIAGPDTPLAGSFWSALSAALLLAAARPYSISASGLRMALFPSIAGTALAHLLIYRTAAFPVLAIDLIAIALALLAMIIDRRNVKRHSCPLSNHSDG